MKKKILIINSGGTIGMTKAKSRSLWAQTSVER